MNKNNFILIAIIILLLLVIVSGIIVYALVLSKPQDTDVPKKIDKNVVKYTFEEPFINNVNNSNKICKISIEIEMDKTIEELAKDRDGEMRDKINLIMRSKNEEELKADQGQLNLKKEILEAIREVLGTKKKVIDVYFHEIIVQ